MGLLQNGHWVDQWYSTQDNGGEFQRQESSFRHWLTADVQAQTGKQIGFTAEKGRYHLYVSLACPWAHRTLIYRALKGLEDFISISVVEPHMLNHGWEFAGQHQSELAQHIQGADKDELYQANYLYQIYQRAQTDYNGRVTVPVLWDKQNQTIVNNESSEIIRMLNSEFDHLTGNKKDFYPQNLRSQIDALNDFIYPTINNGVYRAGFATTQAAYNEAYVQLFNALDTIEVSLKAKRYLTGEQLTEADIRLFTTLIRFDAVYVGHFKTNKKRIADYPNLQGYLKDIYQIPGVAKTVNFEHIKQHYYFSHDTINPTRIVPKGPLLDFDSPHQRQ
ncbi:glutathione S-transferase family protein [uncultured Shewanella sp.]|uniref:glutathione S-transferase family protein n=1 Tax=uncultured Shewanella sp. TaxID=173975 RepID=UPI002639161D|nr:glutathione S-transferase family protein [uncultured Shewanella sp.]